MTVTLVFKDKTGKKITIPPKDLTAFKKFNAYTAIKERWGDKAIANTTQEQDFEDKNWVQIIVNSGYSYGRSFKVPLRKLQFCGLFNATVKAKEVTDDDLRKLREKATKKAAKRRSKEGKKCK